MQTITMFICPQSPTLLGLLAMDVAFFHLLSLSSNLAFTFSLVLSTSNSKGAPTQMIFDGVLLAPNHRAWELTILVVLADGGLIF